MNKNIQKISIGILTIVAIVSIVWVIIAGNKKPVAPVGQFVATVSYGCDASRTVLASYYSGESKPALGDQPSIPGGAVVVSLSDGRSMTLHQTISADGARYANVDESFVLWNKGSGVMILEHDQEQSYTHCSAVPAA